MTLRLRLDISTGPKANPTTKATTAVVATKTTKKKKSKKLNSTKKIYI